MPELKNERNKFVYIAFISFLIGTILFFTFTYPIQIEHENKTKRIMDSYEYMKALKTEDFNFMYGFYFGFFAVGSVSLYCYHNEYISYTDMFKGFKKRLKEKKFRYVIYGILSLISVVIVGRVI